ncbi:MAG: class I SAM-dependent methyltransferase [Alphaproteobacteria bacterium]|jgi:SAM-dependent methyltransferase
MRLCDQTRITDAWTAFWQEPAAGEQCLRGAADITQIVKTQWSAFAATLPVGARVLDIGCGAGAAARALVSVRCDLRVTGIDIAQVPHATGAQIEIVSATAMESLPFANASFAAAISQFGFEYSERNGAARELTRVLAPGARFALLIHHGESSIVAANRARLSALQAVQEQDMRAAFLSGDAAGLDTQMHVLRREHPRDTLVAELARILPQRARAGSRDRGAMWSAIEVALAPERAILEAMDVCCVAPEEIDGWLAPLRRGCELSCVAALRRPNGEPIAWRIDGTRRPSLVDGRTSTISAAPLRPTGSPHPQLANDP